ncbi:sigma-70 family RNA polymerase sigma factor [bacterium]|nr:sigma-70 family RNA polymerase sigma factor [bacterium]
MVKLDWASIEKWDYIVIAVSAEYHKKYDMVELDDIKQSLYEWFVEHPNKLKEWEAIGKKDAKNLIYRSLRNQALDYCQRWKAKSTGYETSDIFYYDAVMIEALLPAVIRGDIGITQKLNLSGPGKPPAPAEGGNMMVMMIEIDKAYNKLSTEDRTVLFYKYAESLDYNAIATEMSLGSEDAARMRHNRAIKKLISRIGGFRPWSDKDSEEKIDDTQDENPTIEHEHDSDNGDNNGSEND